jgi:hypothetical protein
MHDEISYSSRPSASVIIGAVMSKVVNAVVLEKAVVVSARYRKGKPGGGCRDRAWYNIHLVSCSFQLLFLLRRHFNSALSQFVLVMVISIVAGSSKFCVEEK